MSHPMPHDMDWPPRHERPAHRLRQRLTAWLTGPRIAALALALVLLLVAWVYALSHRGESDDAGVAVPPNAAATPELIARGRTLATLGNCAGCHTARGGAAYAGGRAIPTPYGRVFAGNLTPDAATGIGAWSAADFWRALHHGRSRDGRALLPVFPYTNTTLVNRADSDALFAYLRSLPPVPRANDAHELSWPYGTQAAIAVWRALYFRPAMWQPDASKSADWNRGAYLVRGLAHCNACHAPRNAWGAVTADAGSPEEFAGGRMPAQGWVAPALNRADEAGLAGLPEAAAVALLRDGMAQHPTKGSFVGSTLGPMAEVVANSLQHWPEAELKAAVAFLRSLPQEPAQLAPSAGPTSGVNLSLGKRLYQDRCADCHGKLGEGAKAEGADVWAYPPLAGNRAVTLADPANVMRVIRSGGFAPATPGNPRPFGMPPFDLSADEMSAVTSYIRTAWGNDAGVVLPIDVLK